jgi:hypothetical protein
MGTTEHIGEPYAILIRKWDIVNGNHKSPDRKNLIKQMKTLHSKMKKGDKNTITYYSIEKDEGLNRHHIHLLVYTSHIELIKSVLLKFIKGDEWIDRDTGTRVFDECNSIFGLIHIERVNDVREYTDYISKNREYDILV